MRTSLLIFIKMFTLTGKTPNWARKVYSRMCSMDYDDAQHFPIAKFWAYGSTVQYQPVRSKIRFAISEMRPGAIRALLKHEDADDWIEVYRQGERLVGVEWIRALKKIHKYFKKSQIYQLRDAELMEEMKSSSWM